MLRLLSVLLILSLGAAAVGCRDDESTARQVLRQQQLRSQQAADVDHLGEATRFLSQLVSLERQTASRQILYHLGAWLEQNEPTVDWRRPQLASTLPATYGDQLDALDRASFVYDDVEYLREAYLYSRVARWAPQADELADPLLADWLQRRRDQLPSDAGRQLDRAVRLFDWTVRNIRLEPRDLDQAGQANVPNLQLPPPLRFLGPGYRQTAQETLWRGSGDALQRGRVFIALCRQAGVDAAMLSASQEGGHDARLVAAAIGDDLYLFEPELGLPVPGPGQEGIATLAEARDDASVIRRLNVPGWFEYPLDRDGVRRCVALLDAVPPALSRRMAALEPALTGEARMQLAVDADRLAARFEAFEGVEEAALWEVPYQARAYQQMIAAAAERDPLLARSLAMQFGMLDDRSPLGEARWRHLEGQFEDAEEHSGALKAYMNVRVPDAEIENLPYDVDLQIRHGVRRQSGDSAEEFAARIQTVQTILKSAKQTATYWLALVHLDHGRYETAAGWFQGRVLDDDVASPWDAPARYGLARALEHLDREEEAIELYKTRQAPQEHGNRIRARLLGRQTDAAAAP